MTDEQKAEIDGMSHVALARLWRFGASDDPLLTGKAGSRVKQRLFEEFDGIPVRISKMIGWDAS